MNQSDTTGLWMLCGMCLVPYIAGAVSVIVLQVRIKTIGWWGLVPFGGTIKRIIDDRSL